MKHLLHIILMAALAFTVATGCKGATNRPVLNVDNAEIITSTDKKVSLKDIASAIKKGGATRGWVMKEIAPGKMLGMVNSREHTAKINIAYDTHSYSITLKEASPGLKYDGTTVHRIYNNWIVNLQNAINMQLMAL